MPFSKKTSISRKQPDPANSASYCGNVTTGDPRVFGPIIWQSLHIMAQNYPDEPNSETRQQCQAFIKSLPYMLPCSHCGKHLQEFINDYQQKQIPICDNQASLIKFFVEAHNNVSSHTNPDRKPWTVEEALQTYASKDVCFHNATWGDESLCRDTSCE